MPNPTLTFPAVVNERAARALAGMVAGLGVVVLVTGWHWLTATMAVGFLLRVVAGPQSSPLGLLAARVIAPRMGPAVRTAGPPKRFAQAVGLVVTATAAVGALGFGLAILPLALVAALVFFAILESSLGWCAGCYAFGWLMEWGLVPEETCVACANLAAVPR